MPHHKSLLATKDKLADGLINDWLQEQALISKKLIASIVWLGNFNTLLVVAQALLLSSMLTQIITATPVNILSGLKIELYLFVVVILLRALLVWLKESNGFNAGRKIRKKIRQDLVNKLFVLGPSYSQQFKAGNLTDVVVQQVEAVQDYYAKYVPQFKLVVSTPIIILFFIFPINWLAAITLMVSAPLVPLFIALIGKKAQQKSLENFVARANLSAHFLDLLRGLHVLKLLGQTKNYRNQVATMSKRYRLGTMQVLKVAFLTSGVLELFSSLAIVLIAIQMSYALGAKSVFGSWDGNIGLQSALFILILTPEFYQSMRDFSTFYHARANAVAAAHSIVKILLEKEVYFPTGTKAVTLKTAPSLAIENLSLSYYEGQSALSDISLSISKGEKVALIGESGSGKSSLINLLMGNLTPTSGSIKIDNQLLATINLADYRKHLVWVGQNPNLIYGTIKDNLRFANPQVSNAKINELLLKLSMAEYVDATIDSSVKPLVATNGLNTMLYEDGAGLSGGQLQRIAIARALVKPAKIMFLDEPTANIDLYNEQLIIDLLQEYWQDKTVIMVTHRPQFLHAMDKIVVLDSGKILFAGDYTKFQQTDFSIKLT